MHKFYHTIGHVDKNGKQHFTWGYRFEQFLYHIRQTIAVIIFPELRVKMERDRYNWNFRLMLHDERMKDVRGRDKAIARLHKKIKGLNQTIRELNTQNQDRSKDIR